jgi:hypothetical protein
MEARTSSLQKALLFPTTAKKIYQFLVAHTFKCHIKIS